MAIEIPFDYRGSMATVFEVGDPTEFGWRLDHFREGVALARIRWRDGECNEHERQTAATTLNFERRGEPARIRATRDGETA
jgi:hypothetical protein